MLLSIVLQNNTVLFYDTVSMGAVCAIIKNNTINIEKMIHEADKGLYYAKNHGRNKICAYEL